VTDDLNQKIDRLIRLSEENNDKIRALHKSMVWGRIFRIVYWVIIIGLAIGAFYYLQPYIDSLTDAYGQIQDAQDSLQDIRSDFSLPR
jgi:TRAP-type C4-dicarboxylate transport system permease small subunit